MSKVTKCNTDTIPHAALVITAVHRKSNQKTKEQSPNAEDGFMLHHHPHQAGKTKRA